MKPSILLILLSWVASAALHGSVLMLDFGPTAPIGASLTNSPYHTANPSFTQSSWNTIGPSEPASDVPSGLLYSDGTTATGVGVNLGVTADGATLVNLTNQPLRSNVLGLAQNNGVYTDSSVGKDGMFSGGTGTAFNLGVQVTGLAAGTYDVYVISRNTNTSAAHTMANYVGTGAAGANFDYSSYTQSSISYALGSNIATAADPSSEEEARGFFNAIQIVEVPEPGSAALLSLFVAPFLLRRKR